MLLGGKGEQQGCAHLLWAAPSAPQHTLQTPQRRLLSAQQQTCSEHCTTSSRLQIKRAALQSAHLLLVVSPLAWGSHGAQSPSVASLETATHTHTTHLQPLQQLPRALRDSVLSLCLFCPPFFPQNWHHSAFWPGGQFSRLKTSKPISG